MRTLLALLLPLATACFILGLILPLMTLERLYFLEDTPSLVEVVAGLWSGGDKALAAVISGFSIAFPAAKIVTLHVAVVGGRQIAPLGIMAWLGKWSMMDVMLVALVVFAAKTSGLATATTLPGLWCYAAATILTAAAASLAKRLP